MRPPVESIRSRRTASISSESAGPSAVVATHQSALLLVIFPVFQLIHERYLVFLAPYLVLLAVLGFVAYTSYQEAEAYEAAVEHLRHRGRRAGRGRDRHRGRPGWRTAWCSAGSSCR